MLRLVQGDVGSGKTALAAWAMAITALDGRQAALLAPTDLLARQHHATLSDLLEDLGLPVTLLTGSLSGEGRRNALEAVASGQAPIVVGTHALFQETVAFADLALAVVDEQHRFGVEQRGALEAKATRGAPHVLLMTATPIPRTLGQVLYADLDVSTLHTQPVGRVPIRTGIRRPGDLEGTWQRVREEAAAGHRTFVVVPRIGPATPGAGRDGDGPADDGTADDGFFGDDELPDEDVETAWAAAAEAEHARLATLLAPLRVGLVHGRLKPAVRDAEMARFRDGDLDVLVGTTVVEVGVDVPGGDADGRRGGRALRPRPAPPAARPGRPRHGVLVLRAGRAMPPRARPSTSGCGPSRRPRTASRSPSATSSCGAKGTSSASRRAGCRGSASRRSPTRTIASSRPGRGRTPRRWSARTASCPRTRRRSRPSSPRAGCATSSPATRRARRRARGPAGQRWPTRGG